MKRQLLIHLAVLLVLILFAPFNASFLARAQGGEGKLAPDKKAAPEKKPTPAPRSNVKNTRPAKPTEPALPIETGPVTLSFNHEARSRLDPRATEKFTEFLVSAKSSDWLTIKLDNPALAVQLLNADNSEVALTKDAAAGEFKINTPTGGVPADGDYRLRVTGQTSGRNPVPFTIKINRLGLTTNVYNERFQKIIFDFREDVPASVDDTLAKLEELTKDDSNRAGAFELLGIIYLHNRRDTAKAEAAMEQAIKLNGAAVVKISFDSQWRRLSKLRSGKLAWEDARTGWLRIRPGQLQLADPSNRSLAALNGAQIKEVGKIIIDDNHVISLTTETARRPFVFAPNSLQLAETDLVVKLIQTHVMGKTN